MDGETEILQKTETKNSHVVSFMRLTSILATLRHYPIIVNRGTGHVLLLPCGGISTKPQIFPEAKVIYNECNGGAAFFMMSASRGCRAVPQDVGLSLASLCKQRRTQEKYLGTTKSISAARAVPGFCRVWREQLSAKKFWSIYP